MADINSNVRLDIDGSGALATLRELQRQISVFQSAMAKGNAANRTAAANLQKDLINNINATGQFAASMRNVKTGTEQFTTALEKNKLSLGEYFRYGMGSTKTFGRMFKTEMATVEKVARERVKTIQTQYIKLGRDANGAMKAISVRPLALDMENLATKTAMAAQKQQIFNQLLKQGSTNLLNFGKNTQWAGRQLMVGFTIPLTMFATTASKAFMDMEKQVIRLRRVYGDFNTTVAQSDAMVKEIKNLANEFTKYGVAVEKTMGLAADAAAMGKQGSELTAQVAEATRLAVLGGVEQAQALETTISLTNAFGTAADKLASKINFLNSVENQTVTSIEDLTIAIPKAGPVVQQLGGDVEDLAFFLTAMREGGINASEGANALKSGLASLINPTAKASEFLQGFGINIKQIVESNKGDINGLVVDFATALDKLDPLNRARAIEQLFGKFQFSRLSTLFQNVIKEGSQASQVLKLTRNSTEELAIVAERELKKLEESPLTKFQKSVEELKASLIPLGEQFLKIATPIIEFATEALKQFNKLDDGTKKFVVAMTAGLGLIGPIAIMTFGLLANGVANIIKGFAAMRNVFLKLKGGTGALGESVNYLTQEQLEALSASASLDAAHQKLRATFTSEKAAVDNLTAAYTKATTAQAAFATPATKRSRPPKKYASGVVSVPGPKGAGDVVPAMLSPGEAVIPAKMAQKYSGLIEGMISGNIPGYKFGRNPFASMLGRSRVAVRMKQSDLEAALTTGGKNAKYSSAFTTGTGADYQSISGLPNPAQKKLRMAMERDVMGLGPNTPDSQRPTYGYARTSTVQAMVNKMFGFKGKQFNSVTSGKKIGDLVNVPGFGSVKPYTEIDRSDVLRRYGDIDLITKRSVGKRSSVSVGDALIRYNRVLAGRMPQIPINPRFGTAPMSGASQSQLSSAKFDSLAMPFGNNKIPGTNQYTANPQPAYIETYTPGGFGFNEVSKIVTRDRKTARAIQKMVNQAGLKIKVTPQNAPLVIRALANIFGSRFNSGTSEVLSVPGSGNKDTVPAMLTPGEAVIPKQYAKRYAPLINAMVEGKIPGFNKGKTTELQKSHLQGGLSEKDPAVRKQLLAMFPNWDKMPRELKDRFLISGSLTAELSRKMNQRLRNSFGGMEPDEFIKAWDAIDGKLAGTAQAGGLDLNDKANANALKELESRIGKRVAQRAIRDGVKVTDSLVAKVTKETLSGIIKSGGPLGAAASAIESRRNVIGDFRSNLKKAEAEDLMKRGLLVTRGQQVVDPATGAVFGDIRKSKSSGKNLGFKQKAQSVKGGYTGQARLARILDPIAALVGGQAKSSASATRAGKRNVAQDTVAASLNKSSKSRSPSKKMKEATDNMVAGVEQGLEEGKKTVKKAATRLGETAAQSFEDGGTKRVKLTQSGRYMNRDTGKFISKEEAKKLMGMDLKNERARQRAAERKATPTVKVTKRKPRVPAGGFVDANDPKAYRPSRTGMIAGSLGMASSMVGGSMGNETLMNIGNIAFGVSAVAEVLNLFRGSKLIKGVAGFGDMLKNVFGASKAAKAAGMTGKAAAAAGRAAAGNAAARGAAGIAARVGAGFAARAGASLAGGPLAPVLLAAGTVLTAVQLGVEIFNEQVKTTAENLRIFGDNMTTTGKEMEAFAEATGQATPTEIMNRRMGGKFAPINYATGKTPFGESFLQSEAGAAMLQDTATLVGEDRKAAIEAVGKDLSYAIVSGLMTQDQASSIATALGKELGDYSITMGIIGKLNQVIGLDGYDVTKDPIDIPVNLMITSNGKALNDIAGPLQDLINTETGFFDGVDAFARVQANEKDTAVAAKELVNGAQLVLDLLDSEYLPKIEELNKKGDFLGAEKLNDEYLTKRGTALKEYTSQYSGFMKSIQEMEGFAVGPEVDLTAIGGKKFVATSTSGTKQQAANNIVENIQQNINTEFTGDENEPMRKFAELVADKENISSTAKITFMLQAQSGNIDPVEGMKMFGEGGIFDPETSEGQKNQSAYVTIYTELGGRDANLYGSILQNLANAGVSSTTFTAQIKTAGSPQDKRDILDLYAMINQYGDIINATATYRFLAEGDNLTETMSKLDKLQKLSDTGKLDVSSVLEQEIITDPSAIAAFKADQDYFNDLDPVQRFLYLQTIVTSQFDTSQVGAFIQDNTKDGIYTDPETGKKVNLKNKRRGFGSEATNLANASLGAQAARSVTDAYKKATGGGGGGDGDGDGSGEPSSSWLDDYVRRAKNAFKWTQQLTTGFKASADALKKFKAASGGVGLEQYLRDNLKAVGLSPEMVDIISNLSADEQKEFIKRYFKSGQMSKGLNKEGEDLVAFDRKLAIEETADAYEKEAKQAQQSAKARDLLIARGFDEADATQLAGDAQIAWALTSAKTTKEIDIQIARIRKHINTVKESKTVNEQFAEMMDKAMGIIGDRKEAIEIRFEAETKGLEDGIRKAQDQIDKIVNEPGGVDDLQYGLDQIGWQEDEINKKYDKRLDALDKVEEARKRAVQAQQAEFDLARAMASGDASAAASAIQKFRADKANAAAENRRRIIEQARDAEIKNISVEVNGVKLTREQIEQSILDKTKQIAKIEEESIETARYTIQIKEDARDNEIADLVDQELKWKLLDAQIKNAAYDAWNYTKALEEANKLLGNPATATATSVTTQRPPAPGPEWKWDEATKSWRPPPSVFWDDDRGGYKTMIAAASGGLIPKKYSMGGIIKRFASGGFSMGTDTVPAMLTPGEFVMSKYAVSSFGAENMKAINNGSYKGESVYNYEVNINVKSDANADQIARTVMLQLQQVDAQRVRGGRF